MLLELSLFLTTWGQWKLVVSLKLLYNIFSNVIFYLESGLSADNRSVDGTGKTILTWFKSELGDQVVGPKHCQQKAFDNMSDP